MSGMTLKLDNKNMEINYLACGQAIGLVGI